MMLALLIMNLASDFFTKTPDDFTHNEGDVRLARPDEYLRWDWTMKKHHYLDFKRFAGRGIRDLITWRGHGIA